VYNLNFFELLPVVFHVWCGKSQLILIIILGAGSWRSWQVFDVVGTFSFGRAFYVDVLNSKATCILSTNLRHDTDSGLCSLEGSPPKAHLPLANEEPFLFLRTLRNRPSFVQECSPNPSPHHSAITAKTASRNAIAVVRSEHRYFT
jgi:hypothetical protein